MDRTVPQTGSEEIKLYMRTYYSLLRSSEAIQITTLEESHAAMESPLHAKARDPELDISALTYSSLRLPAVMPVINLIVMGQIEQSFTSSGFDNFSEWRQVHAPGRRRRTHYNGDSTLAVFIASRSDIDDLVPILTAYQIEWNKLHRLLKSEVARLFLSQNTPDREEPLTSAEVDLLAQFLYITPDDVRRLELIWKYNFFQTLHKIAEGEKRLALKLLSSSAAAYRKATAYWWEEINRKATAHNIDISNRPVYFVSSNTHSIPNLLTGFVQRHNDTLIQYIQESEQHDLWNEYQAIKNQATSSNLNNFLYYVLKKYLAHNPNMELEQQSDERANGIHRVPNIHGFQIAAQIIELNKLDLSSIDDRLCDDLPHQEVLKDSGAIILNVDYPLGLAAYDILNRVTERVGSIRGVYVMGKAATLNGRIGDVMIPNVIHDEHSQNTYLFNNCLSPKDVAPYLAYSTVLDNQKAISVPGTFLQNTHYMSVFYKEGYTDIEMEGGPYLSAVYEAYRPNRHPHNEIVDLHSVPFDVAFLHYASDTPMGRGHNLGSSNLSYAGIDPTYATSIAILRRILRQEVEHIRAGNTL
jgi:hypothetical protein